MSLTHRAFARVGGVPLLTVLIVAVRVSADATNDVIQLTSVRKEGHIIERFDVERGRAMKLPEWSPEAGNPPLALDKVVAVALSDAHRQVPDADRFHLSRISLDRIGWPWLNKRWYYMLSFEPYFRGQISTDTVHVVVLMDGSIVEPQVNTAEQGAARGTKPPPH
jgi:hypothetical protein